MLQMEQQPEEMDLDILKEIANIGAGNAVTALTQMIGNNIDMHVPKVQMLSFQELADVIGGAETLVAGLMVSLSGDLEGSILFILEDSNAHHLVGKLMGYQLDQIQVETGVFTEIEQSALTEVGNIIAGAYLNSISKMTNLKIRTTIPYLAIDMAGAILSVPAIEFGKLGDKALLIQSTFTDMEVDISGYFIMIPTLESYNRILKALGIG